MKLHDFVCAVLTLLVKGTVYWHRYNYAPSTDKINYLMIGE